MQQAAAGKKSTSESGSRSSGWRGSEDDGGWSQGPPATGSGWTELECAASSENSDEIGTWHNPPETSWSANNNEIIVDSRDKEAWPSIGDNSEETSESGEADSSSVKSGSVISSSSNHGQTLDIGQGSSAIHGRSASSIWGASNSTGQVSDSNVWGIGSSPSPSASMNSVGSGWGSLPQSVTMNNQGHNMQPSASSAGSDSAQDFSNSSPFSTGWGSAAQGSSSIPQYSMQRSGSGNKDKIQGYLPNGGAQMDKSNGPVFGTEQLGNVLQGISLGSGFSKISTGQESGLSNSNNRQPGGKVSGVDQAISAANKSGSGNNGRHWGAQTNPIGWPSSSANGSGNGRPSAGDWSNPNSGTSPNPAAGEWGSGEKPSSQWGNSPWGSSSGVSPGVTTPEASNANLPPKLPNTWAQAAGKGLNLNTISTTSTTPSIQTSNKSQISGESTGSQQMLDPQEREIQRAIESNSGWGQVPVRQDTNWDLDTSAPVKAKFTAPEPPQPTNVWNNNNGTAIWEAVKESKPNSNWQSAPTNHPSVQGGGSQWDNGDRPESSAWGIAPASRSTSSDSSPGPWSANSEKPAGNWGGNSTQPTDWSRPKQDSGSWGGSNAGDPRLKNSTSSWGDSPAVETPVSWDSQPANRRSIEELGKNYWNEPPPTHPNTNRPPPTNWNAPTTPVTPITPHPKPEEDMWSKPAPKPAPPPPPSQPSGWGDPSPPSTKVDDGTSIWAANNQHQARAAGWGDTGWTSGSKPKMSSSSWEQENNMTWNPNGARKTSESWNRDDNGGESGWDTDMGNWEGSQENNPSWTSASGFKKRLSIKGASFPRGPGQQPQMRIKLLQQLMDMGFKKDEAQHALINNNMSFENALADLKGGATFDRKDQDIDVFYPDGAKPRKLRPDIGHPINDDISDTQLETNQYVPTISMQNTPFPNAQVPNQPVFVSPMKPGPSLNPSSLNASNPSINPSLQQKILQQKLLNQQPTVPPPQQPLNTMNSTQGPPLRGQIPPQAQSVEQQMAQQQILQQLRLAVQAGLISPQLLNQRLPPTILLLLQQLLQLQTFLQQLVTKQQAIQQNKALGPANQRQQLEQTANAINRIRQEMLLLQQQLANPQLMGKQMGVSDSPDPMMSGIPQDLALSSGLAAAQPQSRLNQWKRQTPDKDLETLNDTMNLNKAVGSKPLHQSHSNPILGKFESLNIGGDSTWSSVSNTSSTHNWPSLSALPPSQSEGSKIGTEKESQSGSGSPITTATSNSNMRSLDNMIHEFVPGKPWQGMTKNVEDDPHITPGSFSRSLSVNTINDEYLSNFTALTKTSQVGDQPLSSQLSSQPSSTWSVKDFPRSATGSSAGLPSSKMWSTSDNVTPTTLSSQLWGVPLPKSSAAPSRPPPGLSNQAKSGWSPGVNRQQSWAGSTGGSAFTPVGNSSSWESRSPNVPVWLMLRNLTPQIDGSTLKTLCQQHGPLQNFYLNHGQALVRYSKGEEAIKAQKSLNTCILGNTTILAEFVSDNEAARFLRDNSSVNPSTPSQWSQSTPSYRSAGGHYNNNNRTASESSNWNHSASAAAPPQSSFSSSVFPGNSSMWGGNLWSGNVTLDDHTSNPILGGLLGGESI